MGDFGADPVGLPPNPMSEVALKEGEQALRIRRGDQIAGPAAVQAHRS
jgi:hypothetical protein